MFQYQLWTLLQSNSIWFLLLWIAVYILTGFLFAKGYLKEKAYSIFVLISFILYVFILLFVTVLFRSVYPEHSYELNILWEYKLAFQFIEDGTIIRSKEWLMQIVYNIILFVPLGMFFRENKYGKWKKNIKNALIVGFMISGLVELFQLFFKIGLFETSDIMNNCIGMLIGFLLHAFISKTIFEKIQKGSKG